ncbi:hypothetical protein OHT17_13360 [Streptomyces sp. NBC_00371]|uniref:hypothetical protein n=1 Tax=Streptomyces sp. NBC_00371 TaxID=2975729 RepID=UPI002E25AD9A
MVHQVGPLAASDRDSRSEFREFLGDPAQCVGGDHRACHRGEIDQRGRSDRLEQFGVGDTGQVGAQDFDAEGVADQGLDRRAQ